MTDQLPTEPSLLSPERPPGPPTSEMSWSGLIECARDGLSAMRQSSEYGRSTGFREKLDTVSGCVVELVERLSKIGCLPLPGEPSFTLLGRDPQSPDRVADWMAERARTDPSPRGAQKVEKAGQLRRDMLAWKSSHPQIGHSPAGGPERRPGGAAKHDRS